MARRRRKQANPPASSPAQPADTPRDHMARVRVADDIWADFRMAAGQTPLNLVLGELVEREVDRHRARRARAGTMDDDQLLTAVERAQELHDNLTATITALERRLGRSG
jgi:hypothetical protein